MIYETIPLREDAPEITLTAFVSMTPEIRDAMLVIPGGGYACVCNDREGEPIAQAFMAQGFNCFVLNYSTGAGAKYPTPLVEASLAMKQIRLHAKEWKIDPAHIYAVGFSAGGHLCGMLGNMWNAEGIREAAGLKGEENRPAGVCLCYPVLNGFGKTHEGTIMNITGSANPTEEQRKAVDIPSRIGAHSAPAFLMHTANDGAVPVESTLRAGLAYSEAKIPFEIHIYPDAPHGSALANEITAGAEPKFVNPRIARWVEDAAKFFREIRR